MSSAFMIKCVMCKAEFDQMECRTRFCETCRSSKCRVAREAYYKVRKSIRKEYTL
jgi:Zn finger protein HypA/HybF involved in hydrogenase expression